MSKLITAEIIKSKQACTDGYIWFLETFPNGCTYTDLIMNAREQDKSWIVQNLKAYNILEDNINRVFELEGSGYGFSQRVYVWKDRFEFVNRDRQEVIYLSFKGIKDVIDFMENINILRKLDFGANTYLVHTIVPNDYPLEISKGYPVIVWHSMCGGTIHIKSQEQKYDSYYEGIVVNINPDKFREAMKKII